MARKDEDMNNSADDYVAAVLARSRDEAKLYRRLLRNYDIPAIIGEDTGDAAASGWKPSRRRTRLSRSVPVLVPESLLDEASKIIAEGDKELESLAEAGAEAADLLGADEEREELTEDEEELQDDQDEEDDFDDEEDDEDDEEDEEEDEDEDEDDLELDEDDELDDEEDEDDDGDDEDEEELEEEEKDEDEEEEDDEKDEEEEF